jgi:hypothetical protein
MTRVEELHEVRTYMIGVGIVAALLRIGMAIWPLVKGAGLCRDLMSEVSLWWSCWW